MIETKPLICKQFTSNEYEWYRQGDPNHKFKTHRIIGRDDINYLAIRWHFITNRIKKNSDGNNKFPASLIERYRLEMREIKSMLNIPSVPDEEITFSSISKIKPFAELVSIDKDETGFPVVIKVGYDVFLKEFYY